MTASIAVEATALDHVHISQSPEASFFADGLNHIPGTVLRGAMAGRWIAEYGPPQQAGGERYDDFRDLFHGAVRWGDLRPAGTTVRPLSALRHKYAADAAGCTATHLDRGHNLELVGRRTCPECNGWLEPGRGETVAITLDEAPSSVTRTRAELEDAPGTRRERAAEGRLFSRRSGIVGSDSPGDGTKLVGRVSGDHPWLQSILGRDIGVRLGGRRTIEGRCIVVCSSVEPTVDPPIERGDGLVLIVARSAAVFVDALGRPQLHPSGHDLDDYLGGPSTVRFGWARTTNIGGWDAAIGLPKPEEVGVIAGSAWLVEPTAPSSEWDLAGLQASGVGLRRCEGYGEIVVNPDPFTEPDSSAAKAVTAARPIPDYIRVTDKLKAAFSFDKRWLIGLLIDSVGQSTASGESDGFDTESKGQRLDAVLSRARVRRLRTQQRSALADAIALGPDELKRAVTILEAELDD